MITTVEQPHLCEGTHTHDETCVCCYETPFERRFTALVKGLEELLDAAEAAADKYQDDPHTNGVHIRQIAKVLEAAYLEIDLAGDSLERFLIANELPIAQPEATNE